MGRPPVAGICSRSKRPRNGHVLHQAQSEDLLTLESGPRATRWQGNNFPRPQRREHPLNDVALGMAFALDVALLIHWIPAKADDFGVDVDVDAGRADAVKNDFEITLAEEMAGVFIRFEVAAHVRAARKDVVPELLHGTEMTENGIADFSACRRKIRFAHSAAKQRTSGNQDVLLGGGKRRHQQQNRKHHYKEHTVSHGFPPEAGFGNQAKAAEERSELCPSELQRPSQDATPPRA